MADKIIRDATLTAIANAIRSKAGTSGSMVFPQGFISTLDSIPTEATGYKIATGIITFDSAQTSFSITGLGFTPQSGIIYLLSVIKTSGRTNSLTTLIHSSIRGNTNVGMYSNASQGTSSTIPDFVFNNNSVSWTGVASNKSGARNVYGTYYYMFWG